MSSYQERVYDEYKELCVKRDALAQFLYSAQFATLPIDEQKRLRRQFIYMTLYSEVLDERILAFCDNK